MSLASICTVSLLRSVAIQQSVRLGMVDLGLVTKGKVLMISWQVRFKVINKIDVICTLYIIGQDIDIERAIKESIESNLKY